MGWFFCMPVEAVAQSESVVLINADKSSGYGVAYGGTDRIVTCLHIVAGKTKILVTWGATSVEAQIEKIYKPADLALLKLAKPLGVKPLSPNPGAPPFDTPVKYWEIPLNAKVVKPGDTELEKETTLDKLSPKLPDQTAALAKSLCPDNPGFYPSLTTTVINFNDHNIVKKHSGSPITFEGKLIGIVNGGTQLVDGKPCVWAIREPDFKKLLSSTTVPPPMKSCESGGTNKYMYCGLRSDNPLLTPEEAEQARRLENDTMYSVRFTDPCENLLTVTAQQSVSFTEIFESLFDENAQNVLDIFSDETESGNGQRLSIDNLSNRTMDLYLEDITGSSLWIPSESRFSTSRNTFGNFITLSSPLGTSSISIFISHLDTPEDAEKEMARFKAMCMAMGQPMEPTSNDIKDFRCDSDNPYYKETVENSTLDQNGKLKSEFQTTMVIHNTDFIGTIVSVSDWNTMWNNPDERLFFYFLEMSGQFADFIIY